MAEDKKDLGDQAEDALDKAKKLARDLGEETGELGEEAADKAKDLGEKIKEKAKELGKEGEELSEEAKAKAKKLADKAREKAREFTEETGALGEEAKEKAREFGEKAKEKTKEFTDEAKEAASGFKEEAKKSAEEFSEGFKSVTAGDNKKILAGVLGIVLGWAGIHKFVLGYQKEGIIMLVISVIGMVLSCVGIGFFLWWAMGLVGLVEGIIYLTKSDEDFYNTYQVGRKPWF